MAKKAKVDIKVHEKDTGFTQFLQGMNAERRAPGLHVGLLRPEKMHPSGVPVMNVFLAHEFGTVKNPEQAFLRGTIDDNRSTYASKLDGLFRRSMDSKYAISSKSAWLQLGPSIVKDVQNRIKELDLVDTRTLLHSIGFSVGEGDGGDE